VRKVFSTNGLYVVPSRAQSPEFKIKVEKEFEELEGCGDYDDNN
jgi:hypothetical protein